MVLVIESWQGAFLSQLSNEVRIDESRRGLEALAYEIQLWGSERIKKDELGQYSTQLVHVSGALDCALMTLARALPAVASRPSRGAVNASCREFDQRLMLVRRVWTYFSTKWAQRDDSRYGYLLRAADEVVWSCHADPVRETYARVGGAESRPAPLPYVESTDTPAAIVREAPPDQLRSDNDDELVGKSLQKLAVPVVSLPSRCLDDPWWLVLLAHEVGHHLQFDLAEGWTLANEFADRLREVAGGGHASLEWGRWGSEVFADTCSVCAVGGSAVAAIAALELADDVTMLSRSRSGYPPTAVRVALLTSMARTLGVHDNYTAVDIDPLALTTGLPLKRDGRDLRAAAGEDLNRVGDITRAIYEQPLRSLGAALPELFAWSLDTDGRQATRFRQSLARWQRDLLGEGALAPTQSTDAPRRVIGAAFAAWQRVGSIEDAARREESRLALARRLLEVLPKCREAKTRAAPCSGLPDRSKLGEELGRALVSSVAVGTPV